MTATEPRRCRIRVTGTVQGVGFRPFVYRQALALGLTGFVRNDRVGVVVEAQGPEARVAELTRLLRAGGPPLARVTGVEATVIPLAAAGGGFEILGSDAAGPATVAVSVDVGVCDACRHDINDPANRRFAYPFTNCTDCGPRYTIVRSVPYDRPATTMAGFEMCPACRAEYDDPADRRFHAQPNACAVCGPRLALCAPDGAVDAQGPAALEGLVRALARGQIVAVKGVGGFHLAVDAGSEPAVSELRRRKARDDKPFAVMVTDLDMAERLVDLGPGGVDALVSPRRPIVLAPRAPGPPGVAGGVAPGLPELGVMLPYTPLHELLMRHLARPLVMTSGNASDDPIAYTDADALARLGPMVDAIATHDRPIHIRCDDSVARSRAGGVQLLRRSRGYAPEPLPLGFRAARRVLAVGAELKNTVSVTTGSSVVTSHHIGDLEHLAAYRSFEQALGHLCHLCDVVPEVVAHDLHPDYLSTKWAADVDLPLVAVQHHHAHVASCLVDHGRAGVVLGVAWDGLGLGDGGELWGGEWLVADLDGYRRVGHLCPVPLPGGARAIREPWRMALAWARHAGGLELAERVGSGLHRSSAALLGVLDAPGTRTTTSAGRLFDAVAALVVGRTAVTYEGQAAIELEARASAVPLGTVAAYPVECRTEADGLVLDPAPLVREVIAHVERGTDPALVAAAVHEGLGRAAADMARTLAADAGLATVALTGGVFQNARLTEVTARRLQDHGLEVLVHTRVPPNDGGISVGQAAIAAHPR